jgi:hypothetical protein
MARAAGLYRALLLLYPTDFRREYGDDMVFLFEDMIRDQGISPATRRTLLDLIVTVPRCRLEAVMTEIRATQTLIASIAALSALGVAAVFMGLPFLGLALMVIAATLAGANRSRLALAIRTPDTPRRHHRLVLAGLCVAGFAASVMAFMVVVSDGTAGTWGLLLPSVAGTLSIAGTLWFLIAGILTPRTQ